MWKKDDSLYQSSAKVVDGNLILSLPDAVNPVVWRMELGGVKASALEVRTDASGAFLLTLKTPKGEVHDIAPYAERDSAVAALMRASAALQNAEGKITPLAAAAPLQPGSPNTAVFMKPDHSTLKWLAAFAAVIFVIFLFAYLSRLDSTIEVATAPPGAETATSVTGQPGVESGVPQSADDLLRGY